MTWRLRAVHVMSLSLVFAAIAAGGARAGDDTWVVNDAGARATHDCTAQPKVVINGSHDRITLTGACARVAINGRDVTITAESIAALVVNGQGNTVDVGTVARIALTGGQHKITWTAAARGKRPQISDLGTGNTVAQTPKPAPAP
jgi:hypothetical protein